MILLIKLLQPLVLWSEPAASRSVNYKENLAFAEKLNEAILKADSIIMEPLDREEQQQLLRLLVKIGQA